MHSHALVCPVTHISSSEFVRQEFRSREFTDPQEHSINHSQALTHRRQQCAAPCPRFIIALTNRIVPGRASHPSPVHTRALRLFRRAAACALSNAVGTRPRRRRPRLLRRILLPPLRAAEPPPRCARVLRERLAASPLGQRVIARSGRVVAAQGLLLRAPTLRERTTS